MAKPPDLKSRYRYANWMNKGEYCAWNVRRGKNCFRSINDGPWIRSEYVYADDRLSENNTIRKYVIGKISTGFQKRDE